MASLSVHECPDLSYKMTRRDSDWVESEVFVRIRSFGYCVVFIRLAKSVLQCFSLAEPPSSPPSKHIKMEIRCVVLVVFVFLSVSVESNTIQNYIEENDRYLVNVSCPNPEGVVVPKEVTIACLAVTTSDPVTASVTQLAVDLINQDNCLLPDTHLNLITVFDLGSPIVGLRNFFEVQDEYNPVGWVGLGYSSVSLSIASASPLSETPLVSGTASSAELEKEEFYPYFSRVIPSDAHQGELLADLCAYYGWDRVATIGATDVYASSILEEFTNRAAYHHIKFLSSVTFPLEESAKTREEYLSQIRNAIRKTKKSGARIILLVCFDEEATDYFNLAIEEDFMGAPFTYLVPDAISPITISIRLEDQPEKYQHFQENIQGLLKLAPQGVQPSPVADEWLEAWLNADPEVYYGGGDPRYPLVNIFALFRDAAYCLGWAIDRMVRRGEDPSDGPALLKSIQEETDFWGLTGRVTLNQKGDRVAIYDIMNTQDDSFDLVVIGKADDNGIVVMEEAVFSDGTTNVPDAAERVFVDWGDVEAIVMLSLFSIGIVVALVCLVVMMSHRGTPIMRYSSPRFVCGIVIGVLFGFMNVFVWTGTLSSSKCLARPWLLMLNFVLIFGCLYAKAFRFLWVMKQRKKLQFRPIPDLHLFGCVFCYLLLFSIPCIVWTAAYPLDVVRSDNNPDNDKVNIICDGENSGAFLGVLLALGGVSLLVGVIVAFLNRNYHDFFSEATYIGYTLFTVCVTCCVVLPMLFILDDTPEAFYIVLMLGVFLSNAAVLVFLFFPKIYVIFMPGQNVVPIDESGALKTKRDGPRNLSNVNTSQVKV